MNKDDQISSKQVPVTWSSNLKQKIDMLFIWNHFLLYPVLKIDVILRINYLFKPVCIQNLKRMFFGLKITFNINFNIKCTGTTYANLHFLLLNLTWWLEFNEQTAGHEWID